MKKEVLFVLLNDYADYEPAYIAGAINCNKMGMRKNPEYITRVIAPTMNLVRSCGGFYTKPDYCFDNPPEEYSALILIGGYGWTSKPAHRVKSLIDDALSKGAIVGGICNGASYLAEHGFLNNVKHTGNGLEELKQCAAEGYNEVFYQNEQAISDQGIITANGTASLEFAVELMKALKIDSEEDISAYYQFMHLGFCDFMKMIEANNEA